jgi:hypothetical protein
VKGLYGNLRNQIHDFSEFEPEIDKRLSQRDPTTVTENDIIGTYFMLKGHKQFQAERKQRGSQGSTTQPPTPRGEEPPDTPLTEKEKEVSRIMFPRSEDPEKEFIEQRKKIQAGGFHSLQVPLGDNKKG